MLCCVSRKASSRTNDQSHRNNKKERNNKNHENDVNKKKLMLTVPSLSSSGISSSSFASTDNFDSSVTSGLTSSSSSDTSGFSSSPIARIFPNSSTDTFSDENDDFLTKNSSVIPTLDDTVTDLSSRGTTRFESFLSTKRETRNDDDERVDNTVVGKENSTKDEPTELLPCTICARTFKPQSLEKHTKICERAAAKKRKPFDSAKQRIQGTELAEFMPKETTKRKVYQPEERKIENSTNNKGSWKQTHDEFLRAIRAARGETIETTPQRQAVPANSVTVGVPTRPNEKGLCPTCNRQFSIKSYERHVAWCKERATRVPMSAATNIAKERLEARMRYRAPALKNRRVTNREKYSPLSAMNLTSKRDNGNLMNPRAKETASTPNCNNKVGCDNNGGASSQSQKITINTRRSGQSRDGISSGPMKSRLSDRSNRPSAELETGTTSNCPSPRQNSSRISNNVFHRLTRQSPTRSNISKCSNSAQRNFCKNENLESPFDENAEKIDDDQELMMVARRSMKNRCKNIVQARSHGYPRVNDVTINDDVIGMTVQSCSRKNTENNDEEFVTWKKIVEKNLRNEESLKLNSIVDTDRQKESVKSAVIEDTNLIDNRTNYDEETRIELKNNEWASRIDKLDQTYLIGESSDVERDFLDFFDHKKRRPAIDNPKYCYKERTIEKNFLENLNIRKANDFHDEICLDRSFELNFEKNINEIQFDDNYSETHSPLFLGRSKLEPLNFTMIENEETPKSRETLRSEKSGKSLRESGRKKLTKNTMKLKPIFGTESSREESPYFGSRDEKIDENSNNENFIDDLCLKNDEFENYTSIFVKRISSAKNICEKLLAKKIESNVGEELICEEKIKFGIFNEENCENKFSDNVAIDNDEITKNSETSRSSISDRSFRINSAKLSTKKIGKTRSIVKNEPIYNDPLNFQSYDEKNSENLSEEHTIIGDESIINNPTNFKFHDEKNCGKLLKKYSIDDIDLKIDKKECADNLNTSRSLRTTVPLRINSNEVLTKEMTEMQSIVANMNVDSYEQENFTKIVEILSEHNPHEIDLKIDKNEAINILYTSRSFDSGASLPINFRKSLSKGTVQLAVDNKLPTHELARQCDANDQYEKSFHEILERSIDEKKIVKDTTEIDENKLNDQTVKSIESPVEKNMKTIVKIDKHPSNVTKDSKINYQRCGTYVIEKRTISNVIKDHDVHDEFLDDKPLQKRRRTENMGSIENLKKSSCSGNTIEEKSLSTELHKHFDENFVKDYEKYCENCESTNVPNVVENKNREICEKYVNRKFDYDSEDTLIDENYLKDCELESTTKIDEKLSSDTETDGSYKKAFSDSYVMRKKTSLESTFITKNDIPEVHDSPESSRNNSIASTFTTENTTEVPNSTEFRRKNSIESTFTSGQVIPEVRSTSTIKKSREKDSLDNILSAEPIQEVQNSFEMRRKLSEKMELLRCSTNDLIKSYETSGNGIINMNSSINVASKIDGKSTQEIETETIEKIDFCNIEKMADNKKIYGGFLPEIPIDPINGKNENSREEKKFLPLDAANSFYWQRALKNANERLINLDPPKFHEETRIPITRLSKIGNLPPVVPFGKDKRRISYRDSRPVWNNYVRRHPDFNLVLTGRTGSCQDYDPFLIAERQMNDLLSDTCSEKSLTDFSSTNRHRRGSMSPSLPNYPLSHSSAFVKYPDPVTVAKAPEKRVSLIAPPTEFDDFSSDSTETISINREIHKINDNNHNDEQKKMSRDHVLGRRLIIDKSRALGTNEAHENFSNSREINVKAKKIFDKSVPKVGRSNSVRLGSASKVHERKINNSIILSTKKNSSIRNNINNNCASLSGSNVSLCSIVSSDADVKRSNSLFDELASSYDDDTSGIYPSLRSLMKNDSLSVDSPVINNRGTRNGRQMSDEEFSSPDSYKRQQDHNKLSADSAYSSLNRKYSNHGRSTNDMAGRHDEDSPLRRRDVDSASTTNGVARSKMSKFCHECGSKFPETAKFCCECGIRRLAL